MKKLNKDQIVNLLFFVVLLIALPVLALTIVLISAWLINEASPVLFFPLVISLTLLGVVIFTMTQVVRAMGKKTAIINRKRLLPSIGYSSVLLLSLASIAFVGLFIWNLQNDNPPDFFPFDDPDATYTITKQGDNYMILYDSTSDRNTHKICMEENGERRCRDEVTRKVETMIGKSDRELEPFIGKNVQVDGDFVTSTKQCIAGKCHDIGRWAVLNIHSIRQSQ